MTPTLSCYLIFQGFGSAGTYLAETPVRLARQPRDAPSGHDALRAAASRDGDGVNHLVLAEDGVHRHLLLEQRVRKVHLLLHAAAIHLSSGTAFCSKP